MNAITRLRTGDRGQALLEFALTVPIFVLLFMGVLDLSRAVLANNVLANAARDGARYATTDPNNATVIKSTALDRVQGLNRADLQVDITCSPECTYGNDVTVKLTYQFKPVMPLLPQLTLFGISTMSIE